MIQVLRSLSTWVNDHLPRALRVDSGLAEAEGLAAGTGLLTGDVARGRGMSAPCPDCGRRGEALVIDLVSNSVSRSCQRCGLRWESALPVTSTAG